jgi:ABC-type sulfate/molybdate transport systems ATPase subunit
VRYVVTLSMLLITASSARRAVLRQELADIPRKIGVTMIYVTHDRADVTAFGGNVLEMRSGNSG